MELALFMTFLISASLPLGASATSERDTVKAVIKAIQDNQDLKTIFPGAVSEREVTSLQRVTKCAPLNLMKHKAGYFTVVWDCGSKGALGMQIEVTDEKVTSVSTMEVEVRPNTDLR